MKPSAVDGSPVASPIHISPDDLAAYVDGTLPESRRATIAGFLACNPDLAAEVMRNIHLRARSARSTQPESDSRSTSRLARLAAACAACAIAGWAFAAGLDEDGPLEGLLTAPEYVEDALMSRQATNLRIAMRSQSQSPSLDITELRDFMQIRIPSLPSTWRLLDAQVYPSEAGPGISMLLETMQGRQLSLFAVRSDTAATNRPAVTARDGAFAAYWESGGLAYVLTGQGSREEILTQADVLARSSLM